MRGRSPGDQALSNHLSLARNLSSFSRSRTVRKGVREAILKRADIKPYKVAGPLSLNLLDSADHCPPLERLGDAVKADTISEAFDKYERAMPWTKMDLHDLDGFKYP